MIEYSDTTVFNVGAQTIVNTVNCVGVMGAGLALECQLRFPEMYQDYVGRCKQKEIKIGRPYLYRGYENLRIMNFPTKNHWRYPSKIEWIQEGLEYFIKNYERGGITSVAFPKLGCENGGLNWHDVKSVMETYLQKIPIDVYICLDRESKARGIEGIMVSLLNNKPDKFWVDELKIRDEIVGKIIASLPINRFRDLRIIEGVGKQTYNDIFKFLYSIAKRDDSEMLEDADRVKVEHRQMPETANPVIMTKKDPVICSQSDKEDNKADELIIYAPEKKRKIAVNTNQRNQVMLLLKDLVGLQAAQLHELKWCDFKDKRNPEQVTVFEKVIPTSLWQDLQSIRGDAGVEDPVFCSNKGDRLSLPSVKRIISDAAKKAGIDGKVSSHSRIPTEKIQLELDLVY